MAVTSIEPRKARNGKTTGVALADIINYERNSEKTAGGTLVTGWECSPKIAEKEFLATHESYEINSGRKQCEHRKRISYLIRQSFKPGEITPEEANAIGFKLAMEFTGGKHQFIVATHIDRAHIHNHIEFCAVDIEANSKFNMRGYTSKIVRKISDRLCEEHGLSVIKNPKEKSISRGEWSAEKYGRSYKKELRAAIDETIQRSKSYEDFWEAMAAQGYEIKLRGNSLSMRVPGQERFIRVNKFGEDYTPDSLRRRAGKAVSKENIHNSGQKKNTASAFIPRNRKVNLLIDIAEKLEQGKGAGYERWAKIHNLKEAAKTLNFLTESGIDEYSKLEESLEISRASFYSFSELLKENKVRTDEISSMLTQVINFARSKKIYAEYRKAGNKEAFKKRIIRKSICMKPRKNSSMRGRFSPSCQAQRN